MMTDATDHRMQTEMAILRTTVDAGMADVAALRQALAADRAERQRHPRRVRRGGHLVAVVALVLVALLVPLGVLAAGPFQDLDPASPHNDNIAALRAAGITKGCDAPEFTRYCPKDTVTREEMASFLARTAGLGTNPPVANAKTAQTATTAATAGRLSTNQAGGAGYAANELLRIGSNPLPTDVTLSSSAATIGATTSIAAPTSGYVLVTGTAFLYHESGNCPCRIDMDLFDTASNAGIPGAATEQTIYNVPGGPAFGSLTYAHVFPVTAGTHSYAVRLYRVSGSAALAGESDISVLFIPFGPTGNIP